MDGLLLDLDGTLYVGDEALPGAVETVAELARRGVPRRYLTNTTRRSRRTLATWLQERGFEIEEREIFTAPVAAARWLVERGVRRIALYLPEAAHEDFAAFERAEDDPDLEAIRPADEANAAPEAVVVGDLGEEWDFATMNRAFRQLLAGAELVALHRNRYWRTEQGLTLDAGPIVVALEYATGREAVLVGKPSVPFFQLALDALGLSGDRVLVVGDDIHTDVAGARAAGLRGALLRTGKFRESDVLEAGPRPDWVLDSVADVLELL